MDVMACLVSRSGNYQPQPDYVQAIFPDRECDVWLGHGLAIYFPIGKQGWLSIPNRHPFTPIPAVQPGSSSPVRRIARSFAAYSAVNNLRMRRIRSIISA